MDHLTVVHLVRVTHIVCGVFWVGSVLFLAAFLLPAVRAAGPASGPVMQQLGQVRRLPVWLTGAGIVTLLSGFALYWRDSAGFTSAAWLGSGSGRVFGLGAVLAVVAAVLGTLVNGPTAQRLAAVTAALKSAGRPPAADEVATIEALQRKLERATSLAAALLLLATTAMAVARYVP
jgi:uncharacterized membrane protein